MAKRKKIVPLPKMPDGFRADMCKAASATVKRMADDIKDAESKGFHKAEIRRREKLHAAASAHHASMKCPATVTDTGKMDVLP